MSLKIGDRVKMKNSLGVGSWKRYENEIGVIKNIEKSPVGYFYYIKFDKYKKSSMAWLKSEFKLVNSVLIKQKLGIK